MNLSQVVSREEWLAARKELLAKEKEATRAKDELNAARRALPVVKIDADYIFEGPDGKVSFADLFEGRPQLIVYHFMFDPSWDQGCSSCSFLTDHIAHLGHLHSRQTSLTLVSRAPYEKIAAFKARMGWSVPWVSSFGTTFNYDFGVTQDESIAPISYNYKDKATLEEQGLVMHMSGEQHGLSVFARTEDGIFHTYSTYGRGPESLLGTYSYLDLTPLGRQEEGTGIMYFLHHDKYPPHPAYAAAPVATTAPQADTEPDGHCH